MQDAYLQLAGSRTLTSNRGDIFTLPAVVAAHSSRVRMKDNLIIAGVGGCFRGLPIWLCNRVPAVAIEFAVNERALDAMKKWRARRS